MLERLDPALGLQTEALQLRARRQEVLAANIANADTPLYRAVDFDFPKALSAALRQRAGVPAAAAPAPAVEQRATPAGLDGNSVDMDVERVQFADNALRYEATLRFVNARLKAYMTALQG